MSANDQADVLRQVVAHLGLKSLHAIVGASYGGMVALCLRYGMRRLVRIVVVSAADKAQVLSTAWRSVQRQIVREAIARGDGPAGLKLARALAMATYRSQVEFATRFGGPPVRDAERFRFPVEGYLFARGDDYVQKYRAESFLALSESIDLHHVDPAQVRTPTTLIACARISWCRSATCRLWRRAWRDRRAHRDQFHFRARRLLEGKRGAQSHFE
jgi:homoserine O-acetyltransferase